jgi:hypothetical protein
MDERIKPYLIDIIHKDEQLKHPYHDVENVVITELCNTQRDNMDILVVKYCYDVFSRLDRKWCLKCKTGTIKIFESELIQYYRDIKIDQIFE